MLAIFAITTPIFLLISAGYIARRSGLISREQMQGVGIFVMYFALPALIIRALTQHPLEEVLQPTYLLAYALGSLVVFGGGLWISWKYQQHSLNASAMKALGMAAANSGFVGYPVAAMVIGSPAAVLLALNMIIETLIIIPIAIILAEMTTQQGVSAWKTVKQTVLSLVKNPVLVGLLIGIFLAVTGFAIPLPLFKAIDMLANAAGPAALFVIGGALFGLQVKGMARDVSHIVVGKLVVHPLAILTAFLLMPDIEPMYLVGALLFSAAPMISIYPLLGQRYGLGGISAAAMLVATIASFFTLSLIIWLISLTDWLLF